MRRFELIHIMQLYRNEAERSNIIGAECPSMAINSSDVLESLPNYPAFPTTLISRFASIIELSIQDEIFS